MADKRGITCNKSVIRNSLIILTDTFFKNLDKLGEKLLFKWQINKQEFVTFDLSPLRIYEFVIMHECMNQFSYILTKNIFDELMMASILCHKPVSILNTNQQKYALYLRSSIYIQMFL